MKKVLIFIIAILLTCSLFGCGGEVDNDPRTKLYFNYYKAGYGDAWAKALVEKYNSLQDTVKIIPLGDRDMFETAYKDINANSKYMADIYTMGSHIDALGRDGKLEDLSDLYDDVIETIDGVDYTIDDIVFEYSKQNSTFGGKTYGIPWFESIMSIVYNAGMFDTFGWTIPTTMTEFFALCEEINDESIYPIVYCGSQDQGYLPALFDTWLYQAEGDANIEEFLKFEDAEVFDAQFESRKKIYETYARIVKGGYAHPNSPGYGTQEAQRQFIMGNAAMIVNGAWLPTEMEATLKDYPNFKMGIMPLPHINDDKKAKDGTDTENVLVKATNSYVIPKNSANKEEAKKFLKWMLTQENLQLFAEKCNGTVRPYTIFEPDTSKLSSFGKTAYNMLLQGRSVTYYSTAPIYVTGKVGLYAAASGEFITAMQSMTLQNALNAASTYATQDYTVASTAFSTWG